MLPKGKTFCHRGIRYLQFSVPPVDAITDLHGDVVDPQLTVFFAGNQFMLVHDLMAAFKLVHPQYRRIYVETLPPGFWPDRSRPDRW